MKNIAPKILRQRLLLEGFYTIDVDKDKIQDYFSFILKSLNLKAYGEAIIFSPSGDGKEENQGYDAFIPLIDSGISLYVWTNAKFFSLIIYTCKKFDAKIAIESTKEFFGATKVEFKEF